MPNKHEITTPAPGKEAVPPLEKLLNESMTGAQALMILGQAPPEPGQTIPRLTRNLITEAAKKIPSQHSERINRASFNERDEFWKNLKDISPAERMKVWRRSMNAFLDPIKKEPARTTELTFLKKLLREDDKKNLDEVEVTADTIYGVFMQGKSGGDVEFFARRIVDIKNITVDEIEQNKDLIKNLGKIYGENSAKIAELLTHGIFNAKKNPVDFIKSAQKNLDESNYDVTIWADLDKNSKEWEKKEYEKKVLFRTQVALQKPPEKTGISKELHPLVENAGEASEKDMWKGRDFPNQDASFMDSEHGAFGVFDGVGGSIEGDLASNTAKKYVKEALSQLPENLNIIEAEKETAKALIQASEKIWEINEPRYLKKKEEYEKKRAPHPLDDEDLNNINAESCMSTTAVVVKLWQKTGLNSKSAPDGQKKAIIAWAGDSRAYLMRQGKLECITIDDTIVSDLVPPHAAKRIQDKKDKAVNYRELEKTAIVLKSSNKEDLPILEKIKRNPELMNRRIAIPADPTAPGVEISLPYSWFDFPGTTKTLSGKDLEPNVKSIDILPGDRIVIASDGVSNYSKIFEMEKILNDPVNKKAEKAAKALIAFAKRDEARSPQDDTTAIVVNIK